MPNINLDRLREQLKTTSTALVNAVQSGDIEQVNACLAQYGEAYKAIHDDGTLERVVEQLNNNILTARGIRPITAEERKFADALIEANKSDNPKQALSGVPQALPQTIIDTIIENMRTEHPLLNHIDLRSTAFNVRSIYTEDGSYEATWGPIIGKITTELSLTIKMLDSTQHKLTAFLPVPKAYVDFSAEWIISLIVSMLTEAYSLGLENGIINGTGKDQPIGMTKDLKGSVQEGVYTNKTAVKVTKIDAETYPALVAKLAVSGNGKPRTLDHVLLICSPEDYLTKVCPATTVLRTDGTYKNDVFPFPTTVIQSAKVTTGTAILGVENGYIQTIGAGKDNVIDYNDSCQFLEGNRVYTINGYGNGRPKDNNSFIVLDISKLEVLIQKVQVVGTVSTSAAGA